MNYGKSSKSYLFKYIIGLIVVLFVIVTNIIAKTDKYDCKISFLPDDKLLKPLLSDIENAKKSIYMAIYMFKTDDHKFNLSTLIEEALYDALKKGVKVYIIFDKGKGDDITTDFNEDTADELKRKGAIVQFDTPQKRLHAKITVIDEKIVYIGSHNYTHSAFKYNNEATVRVESEQLAKEVINYIKGLR